MNKTKTDVVNQRKLDVILLGRKIVEISVDGDVVDLQLDNDTHFIFTSKVVIKAKKSKKA